MTKNNLDLLISMAAEHLAQCYTDITNDEDMYEGMPFEMRVNSDFRSLFDDEEFVSKFKFSLEEYERLRVDDIRDEDDAIIISVTKCE